MTRHTPGDPTVVHHMAALDGHNNPPNSLAAIRACLQAGAAWIEVDINALAEDDYLLVHEPNLEEETSGHGRVAECTPAQALTLTLRQPGAGGAVPVALLSQVVSCFLSTPGKARLQLDFKNTRPFPNDEPLKRLVRLIEPLGERVLVSSGADWQLRKLRRLAPWLALGFDVMSYIHWAPPDATPREEPPYRIGAYGYYDDQPLAGLPGWSSQDYLRDRCESLARLVPGVSILYLDYHLIAQSLEDGFNWADCLHELDIRLDAWTMDVTSPIATHLAPRLLSAGVDLFTSNTPLALAKNIGIPG